MVILADLTVTQPAAGGISLLELLVKGGVIIIPIILLSFLTIYIFVQKLLFISKNSKVERDFTNRILRELEKGKIDEALHVCRNNNSMGKIFESGVQFVGKPVREIEAIMETSANVEISKMEKHTAYLGIIAGVAPMLGFIGTIAGVITIFYNISMSDNISIGVISDGLYKKMVSSGTGLLVGVVAYACYHYLQMQIDKFMHKLQEEELHFIKSIQQ
ncbi:MAG: MotA/TolQ/ExbB proton channel family protein [Bacteroidota bacterium]|nr:MotA/TolQ/ExbB proton channel family protein [Bacteroidota bacterium]